MASASGQTAIQITVTDEGGAGSSSVAYQDEPSRGGTNTGGGLSPHSASSSKRTNTSSQYVVKSSQGMAITVREKHGSFRAAVPYMPFPFALICCFFNIFIPGFGTILSAFTVFCCGFTETPSSCRAFLWNILAGLLQAITFVFIVGWIWSISWGMTFVTLAADYQEEKKNRSQKIKYQSAT